MSPGSPDKRPYVRKKYYIKRDFQKRFISGYLLLTLSGILTANLILYTILLKEVDDAFYKAHIGITTTSDVVMSPLFFTAAVAIALAVAAVLVTTAVNTWKVRSRLLCLSEGMHGLHALDMTVQVKSCRGDRLTEEVSEIFNKTAQRLNKKVGSIKTGIDDLETAALSIDTQKPDEVEKLLIKINSIEDGLSAFKLER